MSAATKIGPRDDRLESKEYLACIKLKVRLGQSKYTHHHHHCRMAQLTLIDLGAMKINAIVYAAKENEKSVPVIVISKQLHFSTKVDLRRVGSWTPPLDPYRLPLSILCLWAGYKSPSSSFSTILLWLLTGHFQASWRCCLAYMARPGFVIPE